MSHELDKAEILEQFLKDIANHKMTIENDNGVFRSVLFTKQDNSSMHHFRITTWPNHLCISGDMGTYVFDRLHDMFGFFRDFPNINPDYWAEKLKADSTFVGYKSFDWDYFYKQLEEDLIQSNPDIDPEEIKTELEEIMVDIEQDEVGAVSLLNNWERHTENLELDFFDVSAWSKYTRHYLWCCYAITWAVQQYDSYKKDNEVPKLVKDGMVAVLYNSELGIGWSTDFGGGPIEDAEKKLFNPTYAQAILDGTEKDVDWPLDHYPDDVKVAWVKQGKRFFISEYEGSEKVVEIDNDFGYVA